MVHNRAPEEQRARRLELQGDGRAVGRELSPQPPDWAGFLRRYCAGCRQFC